jgi:GNAT superfamily N-acetyltransferase
MEIATDPVDRRLTVDSAEADDVAPVIEPLFYEYGEWIVRRLGQDFGITFTAADMERHHEAFRRETPRLLGPGGRLLLARLDDDPVGVGALLPVDDTTAEIKRMYVRPAARGHGVGRAILTRLLGEARRERYVTLRLETLRFMTTALAMYRAFGFVETPMFDESETAKSGLEPFTVFMELDLG